MQKKNFTCTSYRKEALMMMKTVEERKVLHLRSFSFATNKSELMLTFTIVVKYSQNVNKE